jgi:hypothetical protein
MSFRTLTKRLVCNCRQICDSEVTDKLNYDRISSRITLCTVEWNSLIIVPV